MNKWRIYYMKGKHKFPWVLESFDGHVAYFADWLTARDWFLFHLKHPESVAH